MKQIISYQNLQSLKGPWIVSREQIKAAVTEFGTEGSDINEILHAVLQQMTTSDPKQYNLKLELRDGIQLEDISEFAKKQFRIQQIRLIIQPQLQASFQI